jgi:hypothetical protein
MMDDEPMMASQPLLVTSFKGTLFEYQTQRPSLHSMICSSGSQAFFRQAYAHVIALASTWTSKYQQCPQVILIECNGHPRANNDCI